MKFPENQVTQVHIFLLLILIYSCSNPQNKIDQESEFPYGENPESGQYLENSNVKVYFETYGRRTDPPLVLIHGNGGSIQAMKLQIDFFKESYYVDVADNRTHGKSGGKDNVTYDIMAKDYIDIMDQLEVDSASVLGHSDGGIIGLLMAIYHPDWISKLVSAVPNLVPGEESIEAWELKFSKNYRSLIDSMLAAKDNSRDWEVERIHMDLMKNEPNIELSELSKIRCPVLIMTSDDDIIKPRHILQIYENIPRAQLFMMPGATHFMIIDEYELYNMMVNRFHAKPFTRPRSQEVLMKIIGFED